MTTQTASIKLSAHTSWLFAFGSIAAAIGVSYALSGLGQKASAAIYFAVVASGGFLSTYMTRARLGGAIATFLVGAAIAAFAYFELVQHLMAAGVSAMADVTSAGQAHAEGVEAGATMGKMFGIFVAVVIFLETIVAGIGGAIAGAKSRSGDGLAALGQLAKAAR